MKPMNMMMAVMMAVMASGCASSERVDMAAMRESETAVIATLDGVGVNPWSALIASAKDRVPPAYTIEEHTLPDGTVVPEIPVWQPLEGLLVTIAADAYVAGSQSEQLGDLNGDGVVNVADLVILLANWD